MANKPLTAGAALFALAALPGVANAGVAFPSPGQGPPTCLGAEGPPAGAPGQALFGPEGQFGPPGQFLGGEGPVGPAVPVLLGQENCGIGPFGGEGGLKPTFNAK